MGFPSKEDFAALARVIDAMRVDVTARLDALIVLQGGTPPTGDDE